MNKIKTLGLALIVAPLLTLLSSSAYAVNKIPLKPDSANAAPATVYGSPSNGISIGKTTAPNSALDVNGIGQFAFFGSPKTALAALQVSSAIALTTGYETVVSTGGAVTLTSTPTLSTTTTTSGFAVTDGIFLVLTSTTTAGTITVQDNGTLSGSLLELGAATRTITLNKGLLLQYQSAIGKWVEIAFFNN